MKEESFNAKESITLTIVEIEFLEYPKVQNLLDFGASVNIPNARLRNIWHFPSSALQTLALYAC